MQMKAAVELAIKNGYPEWMNKKRKENEICLQSSRPDGRNGARDRVGES